MKAWTYLVRWAPAILRLAATLLLLGTASLVAASPRSITVAIGNDSVPYYFIDRKGDPQGLVVDLWRLWSRKTGVAVRFVGADFAGSLALVREGGADVQAGCFKSPAREQYLDFVTPVCEVSTNYFVNRNVYGVKNLQDLRGLRVGVIEGDFALDYLKSRLPESSLAVYPNNVALFEAVKNGDLLAFVKDTAIGVTMLSRLGLLQKFRYEIEHPLYERPWYAAVRRGDRRLAEVIRDGFAKISPEERAALEVRWTRGATFKVGDRLVVACVKDFAPFSMLSRSGRPAGMLVDIWRLWAKKTNREVEFRFSDWSETLDEVRRGDADIHSGLFETPERKAYLDFSQPFYEVSSSFFYNPQRVQPVGPRDLDGRRVGVLKDSYQERYLRDEYPGIERVPFADMDDILQAALSGGVDAFLAEDPSALTALDRFGERGNFRSLEAAPIRNQLRAAVRKDEAELLALVKNGLEAVGRAELAKVERNWISASDMRYFDRRDETLRLTAEEQAWLAEHKVIVLGGEADWPPLDFADARGIHQGVSEDYLRLLGNRLGIRLEVVTSLPWADMLEKAKSGELAGVVCIAKNQERERYFQFTKPYFSCPYVVFTRRDHGPIRGLEDLYGKTVAVEKGFYLQGRLEKEYPQIKLLLTRNTIAALRAVTDKKADAYVGNLMVANYLSREENIDVLRVAATSPWPSSQLRIAIRKDWPILVGLLDKALDSIGGEQQKEINQRWMYSSPASRQPGPLNLTPAEKTWLQEHKTFRLGVDPSWPPFELINPDGVYAGMASDYVRLLEEKLAVGMKPTPGLSWDQVIAEAKAGKIDLFPCITKTPERSKFLNFTRPYLTFPMVIVTTIDAPFVSGLRDLEGKTVAVGKGYASHETLEKNHPGIRLVPVPDIREGLRKLSQGKVDAVVGNLASVAYFAREENLANIKIAASTPYSFSLSFGVRKDWPELVGILEKAMETISQRQRNEIHNAWVTMRFEHGVDWQYVWRLVAVIVVVCLALFGVFIFWNTRLKGEIRQRKAAEKALVKSETHLRLLVESSADAIIDLDLDRRFIDCNRAFSDLFGYAKEEVVNNSVRLIHGSQETFLEFGQTVYPVVLEKGSWRGEWLYRQKDGTDVHMETTLSAYRSQDGAVEGYISIIRDISERKQAEEDLRNSRRRLAEIIDFLPDATLVIDNDGRVVAWNRAMEDLTGVEDTEMLGKGDYAYAVPFYGVRRPILIDLVRRWDEKVSGQYIYIKKVGDSLVAQSFQPHLGNDGLYLSSVARALYDSAGREAGAIETIRNITDQKLTELALEKAAQELEQKVAERTAEIQSAVAALQTEIMERRQIEHSLRKSEEEHRAVLESSPNCIVAYDRDGRAIYVNPAFTRVFGWTPEDVIGRKIDFVPEENRPETMQAIQTVYVEESGFFTFESRRRTKGGGLIDVSISSAVFRDASGEPMGLIVNIADISERKRAENELRIYRERLEMLVEARTAELEVALNRAQDADRLKSAFLASMSHELRTPLNSIIGFTGIILQGLVGPLNEEQVKQMNMVKRSANHLLSLINDVLDISKIEAGQLTVDSEVVDVREVIEEVEQGLRPAAEGKGLELVCEIAPEVGRVVSDRRRVGQILINLVNNAIKFTEHGGVYLTCRQRDGFIETSVRDTGIGVQPEDQPKLFKAFQQIDTGLTRRYEGTGLGLNICKRLIELLGGSIWMESGGAGKGSAFSFTLPLSRETQDE